MAQVLLGLRHFFGPEAERCDYETAIEIRGGTRRREAQPSIAARNKLGKNGKEKGGKKKGSQ